MLFRVDEVTANYNFNKGIESTLSCKVYFTSFALPFGCF